MKHRLEKLLSWLAVRILSKYKPRIVAITGSVGKTSTRNAIETVLSANFNIHASEENYNNEIGVPLSIIGKKSAGKSVFGWLGIFLTAVRLILLYDKSYPTILILEFGADRVGDINYLAHMTRPDIGVVTDVGMVHTEFLGGLEGVIREKSALIRNLKANGYAVLNFDNPAVRKMAGETKAEAITYGFESGADTQANNLTIGTLEDFSFEPGETFSSLRFDVSYKGDVREVEIPNMLGRHQVYASLAAVVVGLQFKMTLEEIATALKNLVPTAGRMRPLPGIKGTLLIDDTYNASPMSTLAALKTLKYFDVAEGKKRVVALGDMLELGPAAAEEHADIGRQAAAVGVDMLVTVGELGRDIAQGAIAAGMNEHRVASFVTSDEVGRFLQNEINQGDIILVKGSQGARMEKITKELMAEPLQAKDLLVRQYGRWLLS